MGGDAHVREPDQLAERNRACAWRALCGMAGTFVARPHIQALLWAIDGAAALVMAAALLTLKHFRRGRDVVAAAG